jgi:hypothetical protein
LTALANEAGPADVEIIGLSNELTAATAEPGWARVGYGEWLHEEGVQRFDRAAAEEMVGYFKNTWNQIKRAVVGLPVFRGHPDLIDQREKSLANAKDAATRATLQEQIAELKRRYPDRSNYGNIADLEARADGLYIKPVLSDNGAALVNDMGLKFFSPHWLARKLPAENGRPVFSPALLLSIGLTDKPNIAGTSLVNSVPPGAAEKNPQSKQVMNKLVLALLAALGRPLANEATEQQISEALTAALPVATSLLTRPEPTALANEQSARTVAENKIVELTTKLTAADTALANEQTAHKATCKARNEALVGAAVASGRIAEATKAVWIGRLERDFATEAVALANEKPVMKTHGKTEQLGDRKVINTARDQFTALVNERCTKGESWDSAWQSVRRSDAGKALYEQMNAPAAKA